MSVEMRGWWENDKVWWSSCGGGEEASEYFLCWFTWERFKSGEQALWSAFSIWLPGRMILGKQWTQLSSKFNGSFNFEYFLSTILPISLGDIMPIRDGVFSTYRLDIILFFLIWFLSKIHTSSFSILFWIFCLIQWQMFDLFYLYNFFQRQYYLADLKFCSFIWLRIIRASQIYALTFYDLQMAEQSQGVSSAISPSPKNPPSSKIPTTMLLILIFSFTASSIVVLFLVEYLLNFCYSLSLTLLSSIWPSMIRYSACDISSCFTIYLEMVKVKGLALFTMNQSWQGKRFCRRGHLPNISIFFRYTRCLQSQVTSQKSLPSITPITVSSYLALATRARLRPWMNSASPNPSPFLNASISLYQNSILSLRLVIDTAS